MKILSLDGRWRLRFREEGIENAKEVEIDATVPGCVQLDLSEAGYLPRDLFMGENIKETEKYETYEWFYSRTFSWSGKAEKVYLVFEGADCLCEYYLNGKKIGESANMLIPHEFCVDAFLREGENELTVHIRSAVLAVQNEDYDLKFLSSFNTDFESRYLRKPAHSFAWDIMPRAVTAGLWRSVRLEVRDGIYFTQSYIHTRGTQCTFYYTLDCDYRTIGASNGSLEIELSGACGDKSSFSVREKIERRMGRFYFTPQNPQLWWPYGYGEANVYDCFARIYRDGVLIHEKPISFGIRDVLLDRKSSLVDGVGQFRFLVNGVEIMCRGSNWVPLDAFHSRDAERYERALSLVRDIGCNMLRCWGGNVYEDHAFFDFCDRNGIMIWQDFAMACFFYPENDAFQKIMEEEATAVIRRLRNHPSIVLWAGDNEVDSCAKWFNPDKNQITREVLPKCIEHNDASRPYLPSSPYITGEEFEAGIRAQVHGSPLVEDHLWGPRDYFKSDFYSQNKAHFVSETGYHGCPSLSSIKKFITPERVWPYHDNPEWILHSTDRKGRDHRVRLMEDQVRQLFGDVPTNPEDYVLASQISQAEAKKYFIERIRIGRPDKTGILWWNLLDGWPQMSDAVVDYYFEKKLAYHYIKRSQALFTVAAGELSSWRQPIYLCNDTMEDIKGRLRVTEAFTDRVLYEGNFLAKKNATTLQTRLPIFYSEQKFLIFEWETEDQKHGKNHYLCGYPPIKLEDYRAFLTKYGFDRDDEEAKK